METNLPANLDTLDTKALMELTGQTQAFAKGHPVLRVNYDDATEDGLEIPRGQWTITTPEGQPIYAKTCQFVPILCTLQYNHYDEVKQQVSSTSVHFQSWSDEIIDSSGGLKCGKVTRREFAKLPPEEQAKQKKIKLSKVIHGFLTMTGVDPLGEKKTVENLPVVFYARGTNYMPMDGYFESLAKKGLPMQGRVAELSLKRLRNDGVTFWEVVPVAGAEAPVTNDTFEAIKTFAEGIAEENKAITEKWQKARSKGDVPGQAALAAKVVQATASVPFDDSLDGTNLANDFKEDQNILSAG